MHRTAKLRSGLGQLRARRNLLRRMSIALFIRCVQLQHPLPL